MTNDTHNYSGVRKAFCTIIRSTEWKDSEITVPPRGISFWIVLTAMLGVFGNRRENRFLK